ncbi:MAG: Pre-mRNA-splicing factor cwc26 [Cirrosporium novae-zelandiae]|nr:MAG: Pre-mRNA-splicing factor cwc26 [Cirrosporium novae-zelandiae]
MSLAAYLAKNYLTADPAPEKKSKKRKRKQHHTGDKEGQGLVITEDDASGWNASTNGGAQEDEDAPMMVTSQTTTFKKSKTQTWKTVGPTPPTSSDQATADAILAATATENAAHALPDDEAPTIANADSNLRMENGATAGLQTAAQTTAMMNQKRSEERARMANLGTAYSGKDAETIYRDASGRIINIAMARAEARKRAEEAAAKEAAAKEALLGDVQRREALDRKSKLRSAKFMTVARGRDDEDLNTELKEQERWNDPAMQFLSKKKKSKSKSGKPLYQGAVVPNRYGVRPGWRWDGVDRGNGFERLWFEARNRKRDLGELEYAWQMDE